MDKTFEVSQGYIPYRRSDLIKTYGKEEGNSIVDGRLWHSEMKFSEEWKQEIQGRDLARYTNSESFQYVKYGKHLAGYVDEKFFKSPRILIMEVTRGSFYKISSTFVKKELYNTPSIINIIHELNDESLIKPLCALLNSRLITWYHLKVHPKANAITSIPKILIKDVRAIPVASSFDSLKEVAELRLKLGAEQTSMQNSFLRYFKTSLAIDKLTRKLESWHELTFVDFIKELSKAIKKENSARKKAAGEDSYDEIPLLTKKDEFEWMELFEPKKKEAQELQSQIQQAEKEIDQMVYELYGLSEEEILIVENN